MTAPDIAAPLAPAARHVRNAGVLLGVGLGGMLDGIVLHEVLQWHSMLSSWVPPVSVAAMHTNMLADGLFHAAMWVVTVLAVVRLIDALRRAPAAYRHGLVVGGALMGWGGFNVVEGLIDHQLLGLHHVYEAAANRLLPDLAFIAVGVLLVVLGWWVAKPRRRVRQVAAKR